MCNTSEYVLCRRQRQANQLKTPIGVQNQVRIRIQDDHTGNNKEQAASPNYPNSPPKQHELGNCNIGKPAKVLGVVEMINPETCEDGQDNEKQDEMEEGMQETTNPEICEDDLDDEQQEEMAEGAEDAQQTTNPQESEKDQNQEQRARMEESVDTLK